MHYPVMTEKHLADRWQVSLKTLRRWQLDGEGPVWHKLFRQVRYHDADILEFEQRSAQHLMTMLGITREFKPAEPEATLGQGLGADAESHYFTAKEIAHIGFDYHYRPEAAATGAKAITLDEVLKALASQQNDPRYAVWLKSEPARLANPESAEHLHAHSPPGPRPGKGNARANVQSRVHQKRESGLRHDGVLSVVFLMWPRFGGTAKSYTGTKKPRHHAGARVGSYPSPSMPHSRQMHRPSPR